MTWRRLHTQVDLFARPVLELLWDNVLSTEEPVTGCVISHTGATAQAWHKDGHNEGLIDVFCPLVTLTPDHGPTELIPTSHCNTCASDSWLSAVAETEERERGRAAHPVVAPLLQAGDLLLFDYRCVHRGGVNRLGCRPVAYSVFACHGIGRDRHNFPNALTLRYD
eukprot:CAMPEP_0179429402 /NCGR_PEP_ID=MMETSP0799-20121207/14782_1 /TAXON_ID=46947 /ORGANISM="Geminigera cryophila, Strain CCMP2564" /LENGTH=165 /DNA_ID=CAMNT_0021205277 /DNA_START=197 /DNA_END=694 /DNA_ORIENTATION=-